MIIAVGGDSLPSATVLRDGKTKLEDRYGKS